MYSRNQQLHKHKLSEVMVSSSSSSSSSASSPTSSSSSSSSASSSPASRREGQTGPGCRGAPRIAHETSSARWRAREGSFVSTFCSSSCSCRSNIHSHGGSIRRGSSELGRRKMKDACARVVSASMTPWGSRVHGPPWGAGAVGSRTFRVGRRIRRLVQKVLAPTAPSSSVVRHAFPPFADF